MNQFTLQLLIAIALIAIVGALAAVYYLGAARERKRHYTKLDPVALANEKLLLETDDLNYGWIRTLITALLTVIIAAGGWFAQAWQANQDLKQKDALQRADTTFKYLDELGDSNATKRSDAVAYLALTLSKLDNAVQSDRATKDQIIAAFLTQYAVEDDLDISDRLRDNLVDVPIEAVVNADRRAAYDFARALGRVVGARMRLDPKRPTEFEDAVYSGEENLSGADYSPDEIMQKLTKLNRDTSYAWLVGSGRSPAEGFLSFFDSPDRNLAAVYRRNIINEIDAEHTRTELQSDASANSLREAAGSVSRTGSLLALVLRRQHTVVGVDLRAVILPYLGDLKGVRLIGCDLSNAIIASDLGGGSLSFSNLTDANLVKLAGANIRATGSNFWMATMEYDDYKDAMKGFGVKLHPAYTNFYDVKFAEDRVVLNAPKSDAVSNSHRLCVEAAAKVGLKCPWGFDDSGP